MSKYRYESKMNQILVYGGNLVVLNVLYLICCLPIITIGAAQAGLFTAIRVLRDKENGGSCIKAFFRGFKGDFGRITLAHSLFCLLGAMLVLLLLNDLFWQYGNLVAPVGLILVSMAVASVLHSLLAPFHATFQFNGPFQLLLNTGLLVITNFPKALLLALLINLPLMVLVIAPGIFVLCSGFFLLLYYSFVYLLAAILLEKPFRQLTEDFLKSQQTENAPTESHETEEV